MRLQKYFGLIVSLWKICYWQMRRVFYLFWAKKMLWKVFIGCFVLVLLAISCPSHFPIGMIKLSKNSWSRWLQLLLHNKQFYDYISDLIVRVEIRQSKINSRSVAGLMGQMNRRPSVWCSKYYFFTWFLAEFLAKILSIYLFIF